MADFFNEHFLDFIEALNKENVDYIVVGGMAVILHGYVRGTGDMDIWVRKTPANYKKLVKAFNRYGMPVFDMTEDNFLSEEFDVWGFGMQPVKIDIMTAVKGLDFDETFSAAGFYEENGIPIRFVHINHLIMAKKASGRFKDLDDIEQLTSSEE